MQGRLAIKRPCFYIGRYILQFLFEEDDLIPISALQHLMFCERQWALIHLEQIWEENRLTIEGKHLHERVDIPQTRSVKKIKVARSLHIRSLKFGLIGIADVVEFYPCDKSNILQPYPIEYKRGKPKKDLVDSVQLCAQVLCLEEMLKVSISKASFFYGELQKRIEIEIDDFLRKETIKLIDRLHEIKNAKKTPPAKYEKKCDKCSLLNWCMPACTNGSKSAQNYLNTIVKLTMDSDEP